MNKICQVYKSDMYWPKV